jgi:hypothetical protein
MDTSAIMGFAGPQMDVIKKRKPITQLLLTKAVAIYEK